MSGHLSSSLLLFLLLSLLVVAVETLSEELSESGVLEDLDEDVVGLLDAAKSEESHTDLSKSSVVEDLVINILGLMDDLTNVSLLDQVLSLNHLVVKSQVVDLEKGCLDAHLRLTDALDKLDDLFNLDHGVLNGIDTTEALCNVTATFSLHSLLDLGVDRVILVVNVLELDEGNTAAEGLQIELVDEYHGLINQEKELVLVIDTLEVVNA